MSALVSILIPARGDLEYFQYALKSIDDSKFYDFEVIVVDDGISAEKRIWIAEYFRSKTGYRLVQNSGSGIVDALNTGISHSSSTYIARLDADDCVSPDRLAMQVNFLNANPDVGVVGSQVTYINENGKTVGQSKYPSGYIFKSHKSFKNCPIAHPSVMIRRDILEEVGGYLSLLKHGGYDLAEDFFLWLRISKTSSIFNLQESLTYYRQHDTQVSSRKKEVTLIAALIVYIKSLDHRNTIKTPILLDNFRIQDITQIQSWCLREFHFITLILLYLRLLEIKSSSKGLILLSNKLARLFSVAMGFNRVQN
jgi:glycosyltransferase involved in cell wall biosynthesis